MKAAPHQKDVITFNFIKPFKTMYLNKEKKAEIFGQYGKTATDTGSAESQIALFSYRISHLTEHLKKNHKDHNTARSLTKLVGKRRALLDYLKDRDINRYRAIVKALGLRR
jgi:small subunit ribosomal protein S15